MFLQTTDNTKFMKSSAFSILMLLFAYTVTAQAEESEFPELIFKGTLISVTPSGKAHQSYFFTMSVDSVITGQYEDSIISFECYAGFHGNDLLEYFNCLSGNEDFPKSCEGSGRVVLFERNFHGEIIYLFQCINPSEE
jgi:hypothetical protein